ncbi:MFS transporter [Aeromicrobium sp. A1-2]|uniref:MFS transporter n=1 Tax=Aeromicrobium sp. A1-2 TaxID=2107713 RepID=UPI000E5204E9|nr:MFS transporter [Aeromicrobium sp. A1-2]AXT84488.1 MFS transporter [Aeromicrobium sp. A1-2]
MTPINPASSGGRLLVGSAIVLLALNLRVAVGSLGVVLGSVRSDLGMSTAVGGIVTAIPVLCFAVFGVGAHGVVKRLGLHRTAALVLAMLTIGLVLRAMADTTALFLACTTIALAGAAMGNIILPPLVKVHFPDRIALVSALYGAALMAGATLGSIATVPLSDALGGWRQGLGLWAALAFVALLPWFAFLRSDIRADPQGTNRLPLRQVARSPLTWAMALLFGAQSAGAYAQFGWFPEILTDAGLSTAHAGAMLGLLSGVGIPLTLGLPWLMRIIGDRPVLPLAFAALTAGGWLGVLLAPTTMTWLWAVLLGVGGGSFTWTLTMIGKRTRTAAGTTALSVFTQGPGYLVAGIGPLGAGILHDATGAWTASIIGLMCLAGVIAVAGWFVARPVMLEDTLGRGPRDRISS